MEEWSSRSFRILGEKGIEKLAAANMAVFGIGGVGSFSAEALVRSGLGHITIIDKDVVDVSNINRQIEALHSTVGRSKCEVLRERLLDISPEAKVEIREMFYLPENADAFDLTPYDCVIDAMDTVTAKICLAQHCDRLDITLISAMGAGNKLDPSKLQVADIYHTGIDPLARVMRRELKKRGIGKLKCVYSTEEPVKPADRSTSADMKDSGETDGDTEGIRRKDTPGSMIFVPASMGLMIASEAVRSILEDES